MITNPMKESFKRLFAALSLDSNMVDFSSPKKINASLNGSGMSLDHVSLIKGTLPVSKGVIGGIFYNNTGRTTEFLNSSRGISIIQADGSLPDTVPDDMMANYNDAWILIQKPIAMDAVSPFILRHKKKFLDLLIASLIINFFALLFPLFSSFVYDKILGNGITETLWAISICLLVVMGIEFCIRLIRITVAERFALITETDIDYAIFKKLLDTQVSKLPNIANLLEKYKQILSCRDYISSSYLLSLADIPFLLLFLLTIAAIGGPMVFISIIAGGLVAILGAVLMKPVLDYDMAAKKASEQRVALMVDLLSAREVIFGSAFRQEMQQKLRRSSVESSSATGKTRYWRGFSLTLSNTISYTAYIAVIIAGVYMVEGQQLTSGGLLAVSMLTSRAMSSMTSVSGLIVRHKEFKIALKELNTALPEVSRQATIRHGRLRGTVAFQNVVCQFGEHSAPILDKINFSIDAGEIVGLAGAPGAGKTTLLRLIVGAAQAQSGKIMIDSILSSYISPEDMSVSVGYKPQDLCLMDGTVEDNVRAGRADMSVEERLSVLKESGLDFAFQQGGLDWKTQIGPRGSKISGGQRQLIALARAMLYRPSLLLLDEPTNGLDATLEAHVARQLSGLKGKSTVLVSTHSQNILSICDRIIVVGQSRILADGPREKILVSNNS